MEGIDEHRAELGRLTLFLSVFAALAASTYAVPSAASIRPWIAGEPIPIAHLFLDDGRVAEDGTGDLVTVEEITPPPPEQPVQAGVPALPLPQRAPAVPTQVEIPDGAWDGFFTALAMAADGEPGRLVRVFHWGDSTIAGDGITGTVRARLQERFGDGGPGFLAVHVDPRWSLRPGVARWPKGDWQTHTNTFGGAEHARYGLAGTVSVAPADAEARSTVGGVEIDGVRQPLHRFTVYFQRQPGGGSFSFGARGASTAVSTAGDGVWDDFRTLDTPAGAPLAWVVTGADGPVSIYGVAAETAGPGLTWETFGVAGSSIASMARQGKKHLAGQVGHRPPDLVVYMTGGNEVAYPSLSAGEGEQYKASYVAALERLRAGAPDAACLVVAPLDQATRERGEVVSKPNLGKMIGIQRAIAAEQGCAFWDARHVMGGEGGFARWLAHEPRYAWTDLMHLTDEGLDLVGDSLADAILVAFDYWRTQNPDVRYRPPAAPVADGAAD